MANKLGGYSQEEIDAGLKQQAEEGRFNDQVLPVLLGEENGYKYLSGTYFRTRYYDEKPYYLRDDRQGKPHMPKPYEDQAASFDILSKIGGLRDITHLPAEHNQTLQLSPEQDRLLTQEFQRSYNAHFSAREGFVPLNESGWRDFRTNEAIEASYDFLRKRNEAHDKNTVRMRPLDPDYRSNFYYLQHERLEKELKETLRKTDPAALFDHEGKPKPGPAWNLNAELAQVDGEYKQFLKGEDQRRYGPFHVMLDKDYNERQASFNTLRERAMGHEVREAAPQASPEISPYDDMIGEWVRPAGVKPGAGTTDTADTRSQSGLPRKPRSGNGRISGTAGQTRES